ncbi:MAG: RibD C-terminal domain [Actinomycetota bacterium]
MPLQTPDFNAYDLPNKVVANFVVDGDGQFIDEQGSSRGISNQIDRQVLVHLRHRTRAVLVGGNTARTESYRKDARFDTYVLTNSTAELNDGLISITASNDQELSELVTDICNQHEGLLVEAGPNLVSKLAALNALDYLCLTIIDPREDSAFLVRKLFNVSNATLVNSQTIDNTHLTIWKL